MKTKQGIETKGSEKKSGWRIIKNTKNMQNISIYYIGNKNNV
jgi:hypothetical protein